MTKVAAAAVASVAAVGAALVGALVLFMMGSSAADAERPGGAGGRPSAHALADIPAELLTIYQAAARDSCAMRWEVLAAVGKIETDHGRSTLPGVHSGENFAGAGGPMQFLQATWDAYGVDGDHDGDRDRYDPVDAIWGAANYLCANGAGEGRERDALWAYNHSTAYGDDVLALAATYAEMPSASGSVASASVAAVLDNPNIALCPACRQDLIDGVIDARLVDLLAWAGQGHQIAVSVLKTGHSRFVNGTNRISNHWEGRAADLYAVDGVAVSPSCDGCRTFAQEVVGLGAGRPDEMGVPWADMVGAGGWNVFSDGDHQSHLHLGYGAKPPELL